MEAMNTRWRGLFGVIGEIYTDPSWVMQRSYDPHSVPSSHTGEFSALVYRCCVPFASLLF